jgi:hypothetical protein
MTKIRIKAEKIEMVKNPFGFYKNSANEIKLSKKNLGYAWTPF